MAYLTRTLPKRVFTPSLPQSIRQTRAITITTLQPTPTRPTQTTRTSKPRQLPQRTYHSALHARLPDHSYTNSQTAILTSALAHVPAHGFTATALTLGARDAGFLDVSVQLLPRAEFDLILFWLASRRGLLRGQVEEGGLFRRIAAEKGKDVHELSVEERVRGLILERLRMNAEVKGVWQDVSFFSLSFCSFLLRFFEGDTCRMRTLLC
jgi:ubiquinone biosynthesis protein COQ9